MAIVSNNLVYQNIYGTVAADTTSYSLTKVAGQPTPNTVANALFRQVEAAVNSERSRRGQGQLSVITSRFVGNIEAADLNYLKTGVEVAGATPSPAYYTVNLGAGAQQDVYFPVAPSYTGGFQGVDQNRLIYAEEINAMIDKVNGAAGVCVCNCDYCTCNCNYCTCNCNYSCTCNCNYSDERLKDNIKFLRIENGLNVYSFTYLWDSAKTFVGVMAQELLGTKYESALTKDNNGYYMVDYAKLPVKMIEA